MSILWRYLRLHRGLVALTLLLAGAAQVLALVDPLIFGKIIDEYVLNPGGRPEMELVRGALGWLGVAVAVALATLVVAIVAGVLLADRGTGGPAPAAPPPAAAPSTAVPEAGTAAPSGAVAPRAQSGLPQFHPRRS